MATVTRLVTTLPVTGMEETVWVLQGTVGLLAVVVVDLVELVDRCGSLQVV